MPNPVSNESVSGVPPALEGFCRIPPRSYYTLGDRRFLERGVQYFAGRRVRSLTADGRSGWLRGQVRGRREYTVRLGVRDEGFDHQCDCPAHADYGICKHVAATVLAAFRLFQGRRIGWRDPGDAYVEKLLGGLRDSLKGQADDRETRASAVAPELRLRVSQEGRLAVTASGSIPRERLRDLGFGGLMSGLLSTSTERIVWESEPGVVLQEMVGTAGRHGIPLLVDHPGAGPWKVSGRLIRIKPEQLIQLDRGGGTVKAVKRLPAPEGHQRLALNARLLICDDGTLVEVDEQEPAVLARITVPRAVFDASRRKVIAWGLFTDHQSRHPCAVADFNALSLALPIKAGSAPVGLACDGRHVNWESLDPAIPVHAAVRIVSGDAGTARIQLEFSADGCALAVEPHLLDCLRSDLMGREIDPRLTAAKGRMAVLKEAAQRLQYASTARERSAIVREASGDPVFKQLRLHAKATRWLRQFERNWVEPGQSVHLLAAPARRNGWVLVASPAPLLARLMLMLAAIPDRDALAGLGAEFTLSAGALAPYLSRLQLLTRAVGAELTLDGLSVQAMPVEVEVEVLSDADRIDWFELRAEIRCGGMSIPQAEWDRLIRGELLLQADGQWLAPRLSQPEAMERLQELFAGKRRSRDGAAWQLPRLAILDWLELRKAGAVVRLPRPVQKVFDSLLRFDALPRTPLPKALQADLRDYQRRGFDWLSFLYLHRFGACLADDMGLGKTLQAIALLAWIKQRGKRRGSRRLPHLVVVPPSLLFNWHHEIERFAPDLVVAEFHGSNRELKVAAAADVILTTYDLLHRDSARLQSQPFDVLVLDEAQALKNNASVRTRAAVKLQRRFTLCLTGTPMENHLGEYFSIMNLAVPGLFGDLRAFNRAVREGDQRLLARARPFILRRAKDQILKELPPKLESDIYLDMTPEQKEIYTRTVGEVRAEVLDAYRDRPRAQAGIAALAALMRLRQVCVSPELLGRRIRRPAPKIDYLLAKLEELQAEGQSCIVFSQFTRALDLLETAARAAGLAILRLDGSVPAARRKELVRRFQQSGTAHGFLISLRAGGVGLNLTRAQTVFHADPWWNPAVENQASDRAHRIGQHRTVFVQRLLMRHSVEEKIMQLKARKQRLFDALMQDTAGGRKSGGALVTREDFEFLLS